MILPTFLYQTVSSSSPEPPKFTPGPFDVICARGKQAHNHDGNKYFRGIVSDAIEEYSKVESKLQRSMIVTDIVTAIRERGNGFLRMDDTTGEWIECSDVLCREKVGQYIRLSLGRRYKSKSRSIKKSKKVNILPQSVLLSSTKEEDEKEEDSFPQLFPLSSTSSSVPLNDRPIQHYDTTMTSTSTNYDTITTSYCTDGPASTTNNECKYLLTSTIPMTLNNLVLPDDDFQDDADDATTDSNGSDNSLIYSSNKVFNRTFFDTDEDYKDDGDDDDNTYAIPQWIR